MKIGSVYIKNNVFLAPMAGVTDMPFRLICKEQDCGLTYTEMTSSKAFHYSDGKTQKIARLDERERPAVVQIFGSDPEVMAESAQRLCQEGADIIDINMGCPTPKIVKNGEGASLMLQQELAGRIINAVVKSSTVPVTVKMRKSWDESGQGGNAVELSRIAQANGASAVAIHGRTREQFYSGKADWEIIKEVRKAVTIPVIGNGDVTSPEDAKLMIEKTGCHAVMIGRAAQGNPWIFSRVAKYLETGELLAQPSLREKIDMAVRHFNDMLEYKGEYVGLREMRKHLAWYIKGLKNSAKLREELNNIDDADKVIKKLMEFLYSHNQLED
jgi:nifR3 family TIM-barrel protein